MTNVSKAAISAGVAVVLAPTVFNVLSGLMPAGGSLAPRSPDIGPPSGVVVIDVVAVAMQAAVAAGVYALLD